MIYNKNRLALLAGIDGRDQYFGKTLHENSLWEAEDDLDAAEDEEEAPLDAEEVDMEAEEGGEEEAVPKEEIVDALAPMLGVDAEELSALVSGDEAAEEEGGEEEAAEEEGGEEELELENDSLEAGHVQDENSVYESRLRRAIRNEIRQVINEALMDRDLKQISNARRTKSVSAIMGYKAASPAFTPTRPKAPHRMIRRLRTGKGFK